MAELIRLQDVVCLVAQADPGACEQLYGLCRMLTVHQRRQFGFQDFEDRLHDVYVIVVEAIQSRKVRQPEALFGYITGVARHVMFSHSVTRTRRLRLTPSLRHWVAHRWSEEPSPEERLWRRERFDVMRQALSALNTKEREILIRFYLQEQSKEQICTEMRLTQTQFRLAKSRAKARLAGAGLTQPAAEPPAA